MSVNDYDHALVDIEALLVQLLSPRLTGATVIAAPDVNDQASYPLVVISPGTCIGITDAPEGWGWKWNVSFSIAHTTRKAAFYLADALHKALHTFHEDGAGIEGLGHIGSVENVIAPMRTGSSLIGDTNVTEYLAVYGVEVIQ